MHTLSAVLPYYSPGTLCQLLLAAKNLAARSLNSFHRTSCGLGTAQIRTLIICIKKPMNQIGGVPSFACRATAAASGDCDWRLGETSRGVMSHTISRPSSPAFRHSVATVESTMVAIQYTTAGVVALEMQQRIATPQESQCTDSVPHIAKQWTEAFAAMKRVYLRL